MEVITLWCILVCVWGGVYVCVLDYYGSVSKMFKNYCDSIIKPYEMTILDKYDKKKKTSAIWGAWWLIG